MDVDTQFIEALSVLGLNEKESQLYRYLLKYGPKTPSVAARYLQTYREDIHRTLTALGDKGMVSASLGKPTLYKAVPVDVALDAIRQQRLYEEQRIQETERKLLTLSKAFEYDVQDEFYNFKMHKTVNESLASGEQLIRHAKKDIVCIPPDTLNVAGHYGVLDTYGEARRRGVNVRLVINIRRDILSDVRKLIDDEIAVRHYPDYAGLRLLVADGRESLTSINVDIKRHSLDESVAAFWCDSPTYAQYLIHVFEMAWGQSVDAIGRIGEL